MNDREKHNLEIIHRDYSLFKKRLDEFKQFKITPLFICVGGSRCYGTYREDSDTDIRGVFLGEPKHYIGLSNIEQISIEREGNNESDTLIELRKFVNLALANNPNIIEQLFLNKEHILYIHPLFEVFLENKYLFLSKKCKHSYSGYAFNQLKRIQGHYDWLDNPPEEPKQKNYEITRYMHKETKHIIPECDYLAKAKRIKAIADSAKIDSKDKTSFFENLDVWEKIEVVDKGAWDKALDKYKQYLTWRKNRNEARAELESKYGFDCYVEETEFLTENGWKQYKDILCGEKLATLNPNNRKLEFQDYISRISYPFEDELYYFSNQYSYFAVTSNHNCFVTKQNRSKKNNFKSDYNLNYSTWEFKNVDELIKSRYSHYHIIHSIIPNEEDYLGVTDDYLRLMGLYCSEGSIIYYKKKPKGISISQLDFPNKIKYTIDQIKEYKIFKYSFLRKNRYENTYNIYNKELATRILDECSEYSAHKKLPYYINKLSKRQIDILLDSLMCGDGTHKKYSQIYYTQSMKLANSVNELALYAGYITKLWNYPEHKNMKQVYIKKDHIGIGDCIANESKYSHFKKKFYKGKVVCFEVPNSILITRFNGEIAFQGNSKHASHLVRLLLQGRQILKEHDLNTCLKEENLQIIEDVKTGKYTYPEIIQFADSMNKELEELYLTSELRNSPDTKTIEFLCMYVIQNFIMEAKIEYNVE